MILDHIENIIIMHNYAPLKNFHSVVQLKEGLFMTYRSMLALEEKYKNENGASIAINFGVTENNAVAINLMHWYSINLINYAKCCALVKFINQKGVLPDKLAKNKILIEELKVFRSEYINSIQELKPIIFFRNKASAHLAYTDPHKNFDNSATLMESMSLIPIVLDGKFIIGGLERDLGEEKSAFSKHPWSLTDNFKSLIPRYFKNDFN
ncbi:MAG: hypothetical protein ACI8ZX_001115 [Planctomycetota bacterium]